MVTNLIAGDVPIRDEGVVGIREGGKVSHRGSTSIGVFALGKELVDGIQGVRLNSVVGCKYDELRDICLRNDKRLSKWAREYE